MPIVFAVISKDSKAESPLAKRLRNVLLKRTKANFFIKFPLIGIFSRARIMIFLPNLLFIKNKNDTDSNIKINNVRMGLEEKIWLKPIKNLVIQGKETFACSRALVNLGMIKVKSRTTISKLADKRIAG